jgi:tripartite-type tricarboxylate transporter receptor subunit TctC
LRRVSPARSGFPSRPITLLVPFDAGGGLDLHARAAAPVLEMLLGQPVEVLNRPGAGGASGLTWVLQQARPDGHTIVASTPSIVTIPEVTGFTAGRRASPPTSSRRSPCSRPSAGRRYP